MATDTLKIIIESESRGEGSRQAGSSLDNLAQAAQIAAAGYAILKTAQKAIEFAEFGAEIQKGERALNNLAGAAGTSGEAIVSAMTTAADGTISRMQAMEIANHAMILGLANTPETFARITGVAKDLGEAMGIDGAGGIDTFVQAAARQSSRMAVSLGLTINTKEVMDRYAATLGITADKLSEAQQQQAFLNEMLAQGESKLRSINPSADLTAEKFERMHASMANAKASMASLWATIMEGTGAVDTLARTASSTDTVTEALSRNKLSLSALKAGAEAFMASGYNYGTMLDAVAAAVKRESGATDGAVGSTNTWNHALTEGNSELGNLNQTVANHVSLLPPLITVVEDAASAYGRVEKAQERLAEAALNARAMVLKGAMDMQSVLESSAQKEQELAGKREGIESEHQDKLAEIRKKGQTRAIQIDELAETEKLATLEDRLDIAQQRQTEFTDKTRESTRMANSLEIEDLKKKIGEQTTMLDTYHAGRLVAKGQNVNGLLAEEDRRYQGELTKLQEQSALQAIEDKKKWGQLVLNAFDAWAQINGVTGAKALEMRTAIALQYGLITTDTAAKTAETMRIWDLWSKGVITSAEQAAAAIARVTSKTGGLRDELLRLPRNIDVNINEIVRRRTGTEIVMQHGGWTPGGMALVGERGPELTYLPRGSNVKSASETRHLLGGGGGITNNFYIQGYGKDPMELANEIERVQRLAGQRRLATV